MRFIATYSMVLILFTGCGNDQPKTSAPEKIVIDLQPFNDLPEDYLNHVHSELKKVYSGVSIKPFIALPDAALNHNKTRYRADSLLKFLNRKNNKGHLTIGLTTKDISTTKNNIKDWGVMGLGYCPGTSCVASTFRLKKQNLLKQYFKVAIHELGHTQGLPHCPVKTCYMRDAEGKNHTDEETGFCDNCKQVLIKAGWSLK